eukprot:591207-Hanusia_phi.AAC.1
MSKLVEAAPLPQAVQRKLNTAITILLHSHRPCLAPKCTRDQPLLAPSRLLSKPAHLSWRPRTEGQIQPPGMLIPRCQASTSALWGSLLAFPHLAKTSQECASLHSDCQAPSSDMDIL